MHYIRLLSPVAVSDGRLSLKLVITTDLGDSLLSPDNPLRLELALRPPPDAPGSAGHHSPPSPAVRIAHDSFAWGPGARVLKTSIPLPPECAYLAASPDTAATVSAYPAPPDHSRKLRLPAEGRKTMVRVMPVHAAVGEWVQRRIIDLGPESETTPPFSVLPPSDPTETKGKRTIEIEEQIGESIALHIWDAATCLLRLFAGMDDVFGGRLPASARPYPARMPALRRCLSGGGGRKGSRGLRVLELGCGVGVVGIGLARLLASAARPATGATRDDTIYITDLPVAEERARANLRRLDASMAGRAGYGSLQGGGGGSSGGGHARAPVTAEYHSMDWEAAAAGPGTDGIPAPVRDAAPWDLVLLSDCTYNEGQFENLVGALGALHQLNMGKAEGKVEVVEGGWEGKGETGAAAAMRVLLATKPRHDSEAVFFDLMAHAGWQVVESVDMPADGAVGPAGEEQVIKIFLFGKEGDKGSAARTGPTV